MQVTDAQHEEKVISRFSFDRRLLSITAHPLLSVITIICLSFLLTSTAWLAWEYHLLELTTPHISDVMTMVVGYALQAAGIGSFALFFHRHKSDVEKSVLLVLILHILCLIPAILSRSLWGALISGCVMNLFCGFIAGYYLLLLTQAVKERNRATVLGIGYSFSILLSWLLSQIGNGSIYYSNYVWIICVILTAILLFLVHGRQKKPQKIDPVLAVQQKGENKAQVRSLFYSIGAVVLLFSIVNNIGFAFSSADTLQGIRVESSRLFYAAGLLLAGFISDKDRKLGAIAALAALFIPFMMLALRAEPVSRTVFWALSYFAYGFYSVYRMIVFSDLSGKQGLLFLSGFGLMIGRVGDAVGEVVCLSLAASSTALVFLASLLFVTTVFLFFTIYRPLYAQEKERQQTEQERFFQFSIQHDLSSRERDILRLLLEEKSNTEIAETLSISENTVKFHVKNVLQKTGCKNRNDLIARYIST